MNDGPATTEKDQSSSLLTSLKITDSESSIGQEMGDITEKVGDSQARAIKRLDIWWEEIVKNNDYLDEEGLVDKFPPLKPQDDKGKALKEDMISENINWLKEIAGGKENWMDLRQLVMDEGGGRVDFVVMAAALLFPKDLEQRDRLIDKARDEVERVWGDRVSRKALQLPFFNKDKPMNSLFGRALVRMRTAKKPGGSG